MTCITCNIVTHQSYFDQCPQCYAFQTLSLFPPSAQDLRNSKSKGQCCGNDEKIKDAQCGRCSLISLYWQAYQETKQLKLF